MILCEMWIWPNCQYRDRFYLRPQTWAVWGYILLDMDATFQRGICTAQFLLLSKFFTGLDMAPLTKLQVWISMATFKARFFANFWKITYADCILSEIKIQVNLFKSLNCSPTFLVPIVWLKLFICPMIGRWHLTHQEKKQKKRVCIHFT